MVLMHVVIELYEQYMGIYDASKYQNRCAKIEALKNAALVSGVIITPKQTQYRGVS